MGKASSSKKVARAAGTSGGRTSRGRTPWMFYSVLLAVVVIGSAMVYTSRHHRLQVIAAGGTATPPTVGTTWNTGYAIYECTSSTKGKFFSPPINDHNNPHGIFTPTAGVIQVSPKSDSVAGKNATLDKFAEAVHMTLNAGELKIPGGKDYRDGDDCGGKPGRVQVQVFSSPSDTTGITSTVDPALVRFQDNILLTIAFMPKGTTIPQPPQYALMNLAAAVAATTASTSTTAPAASPTPGATTTTPAATTTPSATTAPATTAPATTAPATTATTAKK
jgi:hypothetical protein